MENDLIYKILREELNKSDVKRLISDEVTSKDFEKKIKEIIANSINDLFKTLYQHNNIWTSNIKK